MLTTLSSCVLHAPGSFFFYPWKPLVGVALGDSYTNAYANFRRDHSHAANHALHLVALAWTMLANYALLYLADRYFFPEVLTLGGITGSTSRALANARFPPLPLSYLTAVMQIIVLMCSPAPIECSSVATAFVGAAYIAGPLMTAHQLELGAAAAFGAMLLLVKLLAPRLSTGGSGLRLRGHKSMYFALFALGLRLAARPYRGAWAAEAPAVNVALLLLMLGASSLPKPTVPCVLVATLLGRVAAELTAQDGLLLYCGAFAAQVTARSLAPPHITEAWLGSARCRATGLCLPLTRARAPTVAGFARRRARRLRAEGDASPAPGRHAAGARADPRCRVVAHALLPQPTAQLDLREPHGPEGERASLRRGRGGHRRGRRHGEGAHGKQGQGRLARVARGRGRDGRCGGSSACAALRPYSTALG